VSIRLIPEHIQRELLRETPRPCRHCQHTLTRHMEERPDSLCSYVYMIEGVTPSYCICPGYEPVELPPVTAQAAALARRQLEEDLQGGDTDTLMALAEFEEVEAEGIDRLANPLLHPHACRRCTLTLLCEEPDCPLPRSLEACVICQSELLKLEGAPLCPHCEHPWAVHVREGRCLGWSTDPIEGKKMFRCQCILHQLTEGA
jgi:hypothetical protein